MVRIALMIASAWLIFGIPKSVQAEAIPGEFLVRLKPSAVTAMTGAMERVFRMADRVRPLSQSGTWLVNVRASRADDFFTSIQHDAGVEIVQPNYQYRALFTPNDPSFSYQWNFVTVQAPAAWDYDAAVPLYGGDPGVIVAVLDTGVSYEDYLSFNKSPDLNLTNFVAGYDFINSDTHPNDDFGHGTHVASTIAQSTHNATSGAGLAFNSSIMPVKVLNGSGVGTTADIIDGIDFARTNGADVINLSLGGTEDDPLMHAAITAATNAGIVVVAAAGNDGLQGVYYPARYPEVIGVTATRYDNALAPYANYGPEIDLSAPGGQIYVDVHYSTEPSNLNTLDQNNDGQPDGILQVTCLTQACSTFGEVFYEGTSQATPHVAAAAALLLAAGVSSSNVKTVLEGSAQDLGSAGFDSTYGWGLLDISAALNIGLNDTTPPTGSVSINDGAAYLNANVVSLTLSASDVGSAVVRMSFSNDGSTFSPWEPYGITRSNWSFAAYGGSASEGTKVVTARFQDAAGNISDLTTATARYDQTAPSAPAVSVHAPAPYGAVRVISGVASSLVRFVATWNVPSDNLTGVEGYRVLLSSRSSDDPASVPVTTSLEYTSPLLSRGRVLYLHVMAVDYAGNNSSQSVFTFVSQPVRVVTGSLSGGTVTVALSGKVERRLHPYGTGYSGGIRTTSVPSVLGQSEKIVVGPARGAGDVLILSLTGRRLKSFSPYGRTYSGGVNLASVNASGDARGEIVVAPVSGALPVKIFTVDGALVRAFYPFGRTYTGGVELAAGQLSSTQRAIIVAPSRGQLFKVMTTSGSTIRSISLTSRRLPGASIALGDVNGDGFGEIMVAPREAGRTVLIYSSKGAYLRSFPAFPSTFSGGLQVAAGDVNGDGTDEIFVTPTHGAGQVRYFNGSGRVLGSYFVMPVSYRQGLDLTTLR